MSEQTEEHLEPGEARWRQNGEQMTLEWCDERGGIHEIDMSLEEAATYQAGKPVSRYGDHSRYWSAKDQVAILDAEIDQIEARQERTRARMDELERKYPKLKRYGELRRAGFDEDEAARIVREEGQPPEEER